VKFYTVLVFVFFSFLGILFTPLSALADESYSGTVPFLSTGHFDSFQNAEYVNGLLHLHLRFKPSFTGRIFNALPVTMNHAGIDTPFYNPLPYVVFTPGVFLYSLRMTTATHWVLWDDENNIPFSCIHCAGDIPENTQYISFAGRISPIEGLFDEKEFGTSFILPAAACIARGRFRSQTQGFGSRHGTVV
jgi:hypothetical protein